MKIELISLAFLSFFFVLAWLPISVAKRRFYGLKYLLSNRSGKNLPELPAWALRCENAYENLKAFFPIFATSIFILSQLHLSDSVTESCAVIFVLCRIAHYVFYGLGMIKSRSAVWMISMLANFILLAKIFANFV